METTFERHCWAEIDLDALRSNFALIQKNAAPAPVCAVVKANAYGHGDLTCARVLAECGAHSFAVSSLSEALRLRSGGIEKPILILGYTEPEQASLLIREGFTQTVFSLDYAEALSRCALAAGGRVRSHLKADTGMGRLGFDAVGDFDAAVAEMNACFGLEGLEITGLFQHFAVADSQNPGDMEYTARQQELFDRLAGALQAAGHSLPTLHSCNSAGQVLHPEWGQGLVRAGIILYGVAPSGQVPFGGLQPVLTLKTTVSQVKNLAPGQSVSYGRLFTASQPMRVATLCCGYADGYPRLLSSQGLVSVCGQPAPVLGRVCMDQMVVDVTHIPQAAPGSEVCVFGGSGPQDSADDAAQKAGTIPYEILSCIGHRVPRVYLEKGRPVLISDGLKDLPAFDM